MKKLPTLYKRDTKGKVREWTICVHQNKFWTEGGIHNMKMNVAKPTICTAKNIGSSNETSPEQQAQNEAQAKWDKKLRSGYFTNINDIDDKKFYEPMLAHNYKDRASEVKFPAYSQPKLDGIRCIVRLEKDKVVALLLHLNGKLIEWVYKENIGQCLKSKRVASREVGGERVIFSCKLVKGLLQEDKQSKYGIRLLKVLD